MTSKSNIQNFNLHCHTDFSDGHNTVEEMVRRAAELGFCLLGISDHFILNERRLSPLVRYDSFEKALQYFRPYVERIRRAGAQYSLPVKVGLEVDYQNYPGWLEKFCAFRRELCLDFAISGNHRLYNADYSQYYSIVEMNEQCPDPALQQEYLRRHFSEMRTAVMSGEFTFLAHIDYARWGRVMQDGDFRDEIMAVIEALQQKNMPVELNTKGWRYIGDYYPSRWILQEMKIRKIPLLLSDDAHSCDQIAFRFAEAEAYLQDIGYKYRWSLT